MSKRQNALHAAAKLIVFKPCRVAVRVCLRNLLTDLVVAVSSLLVESVLYLRQTADRVVSELSRLACLVSLGHTPTHGVVAVGRVVALFGEGTQRADQHAGRVGGVQSEKLAALAELEIRVHSVRAARRLAILARGENHEVFARRDGARGERPQARVFRVIAQGPVGQVHRGRAAVVNFNPVLLFAILVSQSALIGSDHLIDY